MQNQCVFSFFSLLKLEIGQAANQHFRGTREWLIGVFQRWPLTGVNVLLLPKSPQLPFDRRRKWIVCHREMKPFTFPWTKAVGFSIENILSTPSFDALNSLNKALLLHLSWAWSPSPPQRPPAFLQSTADDHLSGNKLRNLHYMKLLWITYGVVSSLLSHRKVNLVAARQQYSQYSRSQFSCSVSLSHLISLGKIPASVTGFIFCRSFTSLLGCGLFVVF